MVFSDDAFNCESVKTLIGNWFEEQQLKRLTGQARSVPQHHIKRKGLMEDFTKMPTEVRKLEDTFERITGIKKASVALITQDSSAGKANVPVINTLGPRRAFEEAKLLELAKTAVKAETSTNESSENMTTTYLDSMKPVKPVSITDLKIKDPQDVSVEYQGLYTEFSHPIELQKKGGAFKDESGIKIGYPKKVSGGKLADLRNRMRTHLGITEETRETVMKSLFNILKSKLGQDGLISVADLKDSLLKISAVTTNEEILDEYCFYADSVLSTLAKHKIRIIDIIDDLNNVN
jgi:hypothetical protein